MQLKTEGGDEMKTGICEMTAYEKHLNEINKPRHYCNQCLEENALFTFVDLANNQEMELCEQCRDEIVELARKKDIDFEIWHIASRLNR
jgi:hypothetical protein